jgi:threonyl-tRNA synthetase
MLIVGEKEEKDGTLSVRKHQQGDLGTFEIEQFANMINAEVNEMTSAN